MYGGEDGAYKDYIGLHRMPAEELQYDEGEEASSGSYGDEEILPFLQEAHDA